MKKNLIIILALFLFSQPLVYSQESSTTAGAGGMQFFEGTWAEVLTAAKEQSKYIFVDAFNVRCVPCKWMAKNVFPTEEAGKFYNKYFIIYKIDVEKGEGVDFAKNYKVNVFPSYLFFNSDGELVHRTVGSKPVDEFIEDGKNAINTEKQLSAMNKKYNEGERGKQFLYDYAYTLSNAYEDPIKIAEVTTAYLDTQKDEDLTSERNWDVINKLLQDINSHAFKYLEENKDKFSALYGEEKVDKKILNTKIVYYKFFKQWDRFAEVSAEYVNKYAMDNWEYLNNFAWDFFENVDDNVMMEKAEKWAKRSVELDKNYSNTDTYASVLYKLGKYDDALKYANEAVELAKKSGYKYDETESLIEKIKSKQ
jgi:thioredoxin-related protein